MVRLFPLVFLLTGLMALLVTFLVNWERGALSNQGKALVVHHSSSTVDRGSFDLPEPRPSRSSEGGSRLEANLVLLTQDMQKAKASHGLIPSGFYSPGGICNKIQETDFGSDIALQVRYLIWEEVRTLHFVPAFAPDKAIIYEIQPDILNVSLPKGGNAPMRNMIYNGKKSLVGYLNDSITSNEDDTWNKLDRCYPDDTESVLTMYHDLIRYGR